MPVTKQNIEDLRNSHFNLFELLVDAAEFRINLQKKYGDQNPQFLDLYQKLIPLVKNWLDREIDMEQVVLANTGAKGMVFNDDLNFEDFFKEESIPKLRQLIANAGNYYKDVKLS